MLTAVQDFSQARLTRLLATGQAVFWRHDVDFDPDAALVMATLEWAHGVTATYYVMADSDHYRIRGETINTFREITRLGHVLGIHSDLKLPRDAKVGSDQMHYSALRDYLKLRTVLPVTRHVSFHAPPADTRWRRVPHFAHALAPEWEGRYVADSRGRFAHGDPEDFLTLDGPVQVNLHPCWWFWPEERAERQRELEAVKP